MYTFTSKNEKALVLFFIAGLVIFGFWNYDKNKQIENLKFKNEKLADDIYDLKNKIEKYEVALNAANENIDLGNEMIWEAKGFAGESYEKMDKALIELGKIETIINLDNPREKDPLGEFTIPKSDKENCEDSGGKWSVNPLSQIGYCNLPATTFGKGCLDDKECDGACIAENEKSTSGKCSEWTIVLGCRYYMKGGKSVNECRD